MHWPAGVCESISYVLLMSHFETAVRLREQKSHNATQGVRSACNAWLHDLHDFVINAMY